MAILELSARKAGNLLLLLIAISTLLFFLLRLAGDPILMLAGPDASTERVELLTKRYGFDRPLAIQFLSYILNLLRFEFGTSLTTSEPAIEMVWEALPPTLILTSAAMALTILVSVPLGAWIGQDEYSRSRKAADAVVMILQGVPGFVAGLLLIQVFSVELVLLPSTGYGDVTTMILPIVTLASFLVPKLTRVLAANIRDTMQADFVRRARATGASEGAILIREVLPNALLGTTALFGAQVAFLVSGSVIVESIFGWPGLGWLLFESTQALDFPVVQALVFVITLLVFAVNTLTDAAITFLDPRLRTVRT